MPRPSRTTCRSARCTPRTAAGSSTSGSARSTARRSRTPTSPRATRPRTARWSSSPTTTWPREISVEKFVPSDQIDPLLFEKSYYLEPENTGAKPYALLRQALLDADRMAVVTVALRQRTTVAVLRVRDDVIVLQTMMWPDEIRQPDFSIDAGEVKDAEVKMANMLVETLAGDFDADEFEDDYAAAVDAVVKAKIEGGEVKRTETAAKTSGEVVDLLAA